MGRKPATPPQMTADAALSIAYIALVKISTGQVMATLEAQTALNAIGDPKSVLGVDALLAPVKPGFRALFGTWLKARQDALR